MKFRFGFFLVVLILIQGSFSPAALSHPHVFISNHVTVAFDEQGVSGIKVRWDFDEFFTSMIIEDYDRNRNGKLEHAESEQIKKEAFDNLAKHGYFSFIRIDDKPFQVRYIRDFKATLDAGKLIYHFLIPCHIKATRQIRSVAIAQYDPTYYSAILFAKNDPVLLENQSGFEVTSRIAENPDKTYYFDMLHPIEAVIEFRRK